MGRKKSAVFGFIKEKLQERIKNWDNKNLSKSDKEVLIKSGAQRLPSYAMSVFLLPAVVCQELEMAMSKFWWRSKGSNTKSIHWVCWNKLCAPKSEGGMSFRCLRDFNIALLGKQAWLVFSNFKARYYPSGTFLSASVGSSPSYIWRSVLASQSLLKSNKFCRVGCGKEDDILNSPWLPLPADPYIHTTNEALINQKVFALMKTGERAWDEDLIFDLFDRRDAENILSIPIGA
ncbi:hypothetical protein DCAR_0206781 [Daucus carota subsp. sativus]|uniref:Reverse transcriptase zinc-binding domain-containing protein n=1 Tax=Daucus carota subsp. sativus TaxID=79200 RepID=A0AAF0WDI7_DAUCS|nr:hypothetical protein DCAR_0206781 [Daucus carota subsp. sativus]